MTSPNVSYLQKDRAPLLYEIVADASDMFVCRRQHADILMNRGNAYLEIPQTVRCFHKL